MTKISPGAHNAASHMQADDMPGAAHTDSAQKARRAPSMRSTSSEPTIDAQLSGLQRHSPPSRSSSPVSARRTRQALPTAVTRTDDAVSVSSRTLDDSVAHVKPPPSYRGALPANGAPWPKAHAQVEQAWHAISKKQQALRSELESGEVSPERANQLRACLAVDLSTMAPGTAIELAPHQDIKTQYQQFRAALQIDALTLQDGATMETSANPTMPALLRTLTEGNVFPRDARVGDVHPADFLAGLTHLHAPNDAALTATMGHLMAEMPTLRVNLGAVSLIHMEQQVSRDWQSYITWIASAGWAAGMGYLAGPQEQSVRKDLHIGPEETSLNGRQAFILGAADASTSGNSEAGDALLIDGLDKLSHNESPAPDADAPGNMLKAWMIGTVTALPSSYLTYANISKTAKIIAGLPANLLAAIGGAAPLPMTRQKRNDHSRASYVESMSNGMQNEMSQKQVGELIDASERVATMGQLLQKGVTWSFVGGFITWGIQSGHSQGQIVSTMQRLLLNPMEAHALMGGGLLAEYVSVLGATRAEKNANLATQVLADAAADKATSMDDIIAIHEPKIEKYVQAFGRGAGDGINAVINGAEDGVRWAAGKVGLPVKPHMRHRVDYGRNGGRADADALEQRSIRRSNEGIVSGETSNGIALTTLPAAPHAAHLRRDQDIDLERGDLDFGPAQ